MHSEINKPMLSKFNLKNLGGNVPLDTQETGSEKNPVVQTEGLRKWAIIAIVQSSVTTLSSVYYPGGS